MAYSTDARYKILESLETAITLAIENNTDPSAMIALVEEAWVTRLDEEKDRIIRRFAALRK